MRYPLSRTRCVALQRIKIYSSYLTKSTSLLKCLGGRPVPCLGPSPGPVQVRTWAWFQKLYFASRSTARSTASEKCPRLSGRAHSVRSPRPGACCCSQTAHWNTLEFLAHKNKLDKPDLTPGLGLETDTSLRIWKTNH